MPLPSPIMAENPAALPASYVNANHTHRLLGSNIVLLIIPTVFVTLRLISRVLSKAGFWWDDYFCISAMVLAWSLPIITLVSTIDYGDGKHIGVLAPDVRTEWFKTLYIFEIFFTLAVTCVKFSILSFYFRIFPITQLRAVLYITGATTMALATAALLTIIFQCQPIHRFWDFTPGHCIEVDHFFLSSGSLNCALDFAIFLLPQPLLWRLRTTKEQKLILTGIFAVAGFVCIVSIIRLVVLSRLNIEDVTWNYVNSAIWTATEPAMGVVSACLPSLRPLWSLVWKGSYRGPTRQSTQGNSSTASRMMWRSMTSNEDKDLRSFTRLEDGEETMRWEGKVNQILGEPRATASDDIPLPERGIRVKTEITLISSERIDYKDRLY